MPSGARPQTARGGGGSKPLCKNGSACYKRCFFHRAKYDHSTGTTSPIQTSGQGGKECIVHGTGQSAAIQIKQSGTHGLQPSTRSPACWYGSACPCTCPSHLAEYDHSLLVQAHNGGKEWTMYHGTNQAAAVEIKKGGQHGLRPSGVGIYCSRDLEKARPCATTFGIRNGRGVIFELRVRPGRVKATQCLQGTYVEKKHHGACVGGSWRSWQDAGYDSAWVPHGATQQGWREEFCVWDPQRVRIVGVAWSDCGFTW